MKHTKILLPMAEMLPSQERLVRIFLVRETYLKKLFGYDLVPLFVPSLASREVVDELYDMSAGVLVPGGSDFDPELYDTTSHPYTSVAEPMRDGLEVRILKRALADRKPILGICRGCQALAVASGGTLDQHLPESVPEEDHGTGEGKSYDGMLAAPGTKIILEKNSRTHRLIGKTEYTGKCGHHQAVVNPGNDLRIVGKSSQGVTELIEHVDSSYFCFGVQTHPETEPQGDLEPLFAEFANACKAFDTKS